MADMSLMAHHKNSIKTLQLRKIKWGLLSCRKQKEHISEEELTAKIESIREQFPTMGPRTMQHEMRLEFGNMLPRYSAQSIFVDTAQDTFVDQAMRLV